MENENERNWHGRHMLIRGNRIQVRIGARDVLEHRRLIRDGWRRRQAVGVVLTVQDRTVSTTVPHPSDIPATEETPGPGAEQIDLISSTTP